MEMTTVLRIDRSERKLRLSRWVWEGGRRGEKGWYSAMLSFAIVPHFFHWEEGLYEWRFTLCGFSFHYHRSYGGRFV